MIYDQSIVADLQDIGMTLPAVAAALGELRIASVDLLWATAPETVFIGWFPLKRGRKIIQGMLSPRFRKMTPLQTVARYKTRDGAHYADLMAIGKFSWIEFGKWAR